MHKIAKVLSVLLVSGALIGVSASAFADTTQDSPKPTAENVAETTVFEIPDASPLNDEEIADFTVSTVTVSTPLPEEVTVTQVSSESKIPTPSCQEPLIPSEPELPEPTCREPLIPSEPEIPAPSCQDPLIPIEPDLPEPGLIDPPLPIEDAIPTPVYEYLTAEEFAMVLRNTNVLTYVERDYEHKPNLSLSHVAMTLFPDVGNGAPVDVEFVDLENDMPIGNYTLESRETNLADGYAANVMYLCDARTGQLFSITTTADGILYQTTVDGEESSYFENILPVGVYEVNEIYYCTSEGYSEIGPAICAYQASTRYDIRILNLCHVYWSSDLCVASAE
ncbi:MAG: hypothetical protein MJ154_02715 [Candidatus Saccharibacteria bacterium]|nr:hypothetical protein [Candidatus Saccharibacteria bacterium]